MFVKPRKHWPIQAKPDLAQNEWYQTLPSRQREVLALASLDRDESMNGAPHKRIRFADIYHSGNRFDFPGQQRAGDIAKNDLV